MTWISDLTTMTWIYQVMKKDRLRGKPGKRKRPKPSRDETPQKDPILYRFGETGHDLSSTKRFGNCHLGCTSKNVYLLVEVISSNTKQDWDGKTGKVTPQTPVRKRIPRKNLNHTQTLSDPVYKEFRR